MRAAVANTLGMAAADARDQLGEIADGGDCNRDVADPVTEPVDVVRLKSRVRAEEVARVRVRAARLWVELAELREHETERRDAGGRDDPTETAMPPTCARLTGSRKTPVPIMLPATSIVACASDILRPGALTSVFSYAPAPAFRHCT